MAKEKKSSSSVSSRTSKNRSKESISSDNNGSVKPIISKIIQNDHLDVNESITKDGGCSCFPVLCAMFILVCSLIIASGISFQYITETSSHPHSRGFFGEQRTPDQPIKLAVTLEDVYFGNSVQVSVMEIWTKLGKLNVWICSLRNRELSHVTSVRELVFARMWS